MPQVVVTALAHDLAAGHARVHHDRGRTEVVDVVGVAAFVEEQVPIAPRHRPVVEVVEHAAGVPLASLPGTFQVAVEILEATLGEDERLVRVGVVDALDVFKAVRHVPVEARSPNVLGSFGIVEDHFCALEQQVAVVVPDDDLYVPPTLALQRRPEVVAHEVAFLLAGVDARIPRLRGGGFVLDRQAPEVDALFLEGGKVFSVVERPGVAVLGPQLAAAVHFAVGFHPRGRAPG